MSKDELLDLVDKDDNVIGTVSKSEAHKSTKLIHREIAVGVFNDKGEVLIQQRSLKKQNGPGKWEITAAGHVAAEEDPKETVKREVYEELGLKIDPIFHSKEYVERKGKPGTTEARFFYIYYAMVKNHPELNLDEDEVENAKWIKPGNLEEFAKDQWWEVGGLSHKTIIDIYKKIIKHDQ